MLTVEQNEELTRIGPGTPMGELLRRYWYPIAFEEDFDSSASGAQIAKFTPPSTSVAPKGSGRPS